MAGERTNDSRGDLEAQLIEKAARDAAFREQLLRDPRGAIERQLSAATGSAVKIPANVKVVVHEETADTFHLVLPSAPRARGEISDAELASVSGAGISGWDCFISVQGNCGEGP